MSKNKKMSTKRGGIYNRYKPNTAIWIGRLVPIVACVCVLLILIMRKYDLPFDMSKDVLNLRGVEILLFIPVMLIYIGALVGVYKSGELKGGLYSLGIDYSLDEFELRLIEKARLVTLRCLAIILFVPSLVIMARLSLDVLFSESLQGVMALVLILCILIVFVLPTAVYHWSLKLVPDEENVRPVMDMSSEIIDLERR